MKAVLVTLGMAIAVALTPGVAAAQASAEKDGVRLTAERLVWPADPKDVKLQMRTRDVAVAVHVRLETRVWSLSMRRGFDEIKLVDSDGKVHVDKFMGTDENDARYRGWFWRGADPTGHQGTKLGDGSPQMRAGWLYFPLPEGAQPRSIQFDWLQEPLTVDLTGIPREQVGPEAYAERNAQLASYQPGPDFTQLTTLLHGWKTMFETQTDTAFAGMYADSKSDNVVGLEVTRVGDGDAADQAVQKRAEDVTNSTIRVEQVQGVGDGLAYRISTPETTLGEDIVLDVSQVEYVFRVRDYVFDTRIGGPRTAFETNMGMAPGLAQAEVDMTRTLLGEP